MHEGAGTEPQPMLAAVRCDVGTGWIPLVLSVTHGDRESEHMVHILL